MRGFVNIDTRVLVSQKHPEGRKRYYVCVTIDGVKKSEGAYDLKKDARARKRILEGQLANDTYGQQEKENPLFCDYFQEWWEGKSASLKPSPRIAYYGSFKRYILPYFGKMRMNDITPQDVQRFVNTLKRLAASYVGTIHSHFRVMMNTAAKRGDIAKTPCIDIDLPGTHRGDLYYLEPSEIWFLIDEMNWPYKALFSILALTGMRVGEALALQVKNIDLKRKEIRIERRWDIKVREYGDPKSGAGIRKVDVMNPLADILKQYFECYPITGRDSLLFPSPTKPGQPVSYNTICGVFKRNLKKADLPNVTIHSLRHSFASTVLSVGVSVNTLARHLGHSSPDITYKKYAHEISENLGDGLERASQLYSAARETNVVELDEWQKTK